MLGKIFKAYDIRAVYPEPLDEKAAWKVGCATGLFLRKQATSAAGVSLPNTVLVSRDMRPSSPSLASALIEGIQASGMNVIDLGMCDTSFMYFAINHLGAAGGVQTTASHNPVQYNGFKISGPQARPVGAATGLKDIQALAQGLGAPGSIKPTGQRESRDLWVPYRAHILSFLGTLDRPLKVVIDASNGMAGKLVPKVFDAVANLEIIPLYFEITGSFVHDPNPLVAANMKPTQDAVRQHGADLGVCYDGDADRCIITDEKGTIIGCDHLTALLAGDFLSRSPGAAIIYDLRSSKAVEEVVRQHGGQPHRSRVGHVFMKALLRETQGVFGGELSGHFYFRDNFYADSGAIAMAAVLNLLGRSRQPMSQMIAPFLKYPQSGEINFQVEDKAAVFQAIRDTFASQAAIDELDGVTVDAWDRANGGWWFNVRASNTEPLMRLNAEAKDKARLDALLAKVQPMLGEPAHAH